MIVYHGTTLEIVKPAILRNEIGRDFGFGFYTTDIREQAERWAIRRAKIEARRSGISVDPVVDVYEWEPDTELKVMSFDGTGLEWLDFVVRCRSDAGYEHGFDVVTGKIANDNVGETVSYVVQGIMRKEDALERLKFEKINNQIAFCTEEALKTLTFVKSYIVEVE